MTSLEAGIKIYGPKRCLGSVARQARGGLGGGNPDREGSVHVDAVPSDHVSHGPGLNRLPLRGTQSSSQSCHSRLPGPHCPWREGARILTSPLEQPPFKGTGHRPRDDCRAAGCAGRSPQEAPVPAVSMARATTAPTHGHQTGDCGAAGRPAGLPRGRFIAVPSACV